ncbi:MAG: methylmalonyl-CoA mutase family protein, partial [Bacteroidota bacterium]
SIYFNEFPLPDPKDWLEKIKQDLKGKEVASLAWQISPGIKVPAVLQAGQVDENGPGTGTLPGVYPYRRGTAGQAENPKWQVVGNGNKGKFDWEDVHAYRMDSRLLERLASRLQPHQQAYHLYGPTPPQEVSTQFLLTLAEKGLSPKLLTGTLTYDPISRAAARGEEVTSLEILQAGSGIPAFGGSPYFRPLGLDLRYLADLGGNIVDQLSFGLATVVEYILRIEALLPELNRTTILNNMALTVPVGTSFFPEMAKFRAFRILIALVADAMGIRDQEAQGPFVLGCTNGYTHTQYDVHTNLLRQTTSAMSAILGGVDALHIEAYDTTKGQEDASAHRLALNIQHLLRHEAHLAWVQDPGGGAYYVEHLTDALGAAAWKRFQEVEAYGGFSAALRMGFIHECLDHSAAHRAWKLSTGREALVGVNTSPHPDEVLDLNWPRFGTDERLAVPFELLRQRADLQASSQKRLQAALWLFGDARMRNARAQFARNLLGSAGFGILENADPADEAASLAELATAQPDVLVLCSSDDAYTAD